MKSKFLKILILVVIAIFVIVFISSSVISSDIDHIIHCHEKNCQRCIIIHNAQNYLKSSVTNSIAVFAFITILFKVDKNRVRIKPLVFNSLVDSKVQFNE
jgi:hypothetical protein